MQARILNEKSCFIAGCSCHLAHLAARAGSTAFQKVSNFDVEDHQVDLYYYFKESIRRKGILILSLHLLRQGGFAWRDAAIKSNENIQHSNHYMQVEQKLVFCKIRETRRAMKKTLRNSLNA